jgi:hypothetical protein
MHVLYLRDFSARTLFERFQCTVHLRVRKLIDSKHAFGRCNYLILDGQVEHPSNSLIAQNSSLEKSSGNIGHHVNKNSLD